MTDFKREKSKESEISPLMNNKKTDNKWSNWYYLVLLALSLPLAANIYVLTESDTNKVTILCYTLLLLMQGWISYMLCLFIRYVKLSSISDALATTSTETTIIASYGIAASSFFVSGLLLGSSFGANDFICIKFFLAISPIVSSMIILMPLKNNFVRVVTKVKYNNKGDSTEDGVLTPTETINSPKLEEDLFPEKSVEFKLGSFTYKVTALKLLPGLNSICYKRLHYIVIFMGVSLGTSVIVESCVRDSNLELRTGKIISVVSCWMCLTLFMFSKRLFKNNCIGGRWRKASLIFEYLGLVYYLFGILLVARGYNTFL